MQTTILLFYATWCPHCPGQIWNFQTALGLYSKIQLLLKDIDLETTQFLLDQYHIEGVPTAVKLDGSATPERLEGETTVAEVQQFLGLEVKASLLWTRETLRLNSVNAFNKAVGHPVISGLNYDEMAALQSWSEILMADDGKILDTALERLRARVVEQTEARLSPISKGKEHG